MSCPHSLTGSPDRCSQCLGIQPQRVTNDGAELLVDGEPTGRAIDRSSTVASYYARRGGRRRRPRT